ncbi:DUF4124 domain-containing protein [Pseudomonas sp. CrR14]|nr:DUF4124 domain-containing protein [Pseudomonas sp. CrR14]
MHGAKSHIKGTEKMLGRRMLPLSLLLLVAVANAQVYTWVDEKGQKHFSSQPPVAQPVKPVEIHHGYIGEGTAVAPQTPYATPSSSSKVDKPSKRQMCTSAIRWATEEVKDLKELSAALLKAKQISEAENAKVLRDFEKGSAALNMQNCLASSGANEKHYQCLSVGLGLSVCTGAAEDALKKGVSRAQKR